MEKEDRPREEDLGPSVDFSFQFSAEREFNKVEKKIFTHLCNISQKSYKAKNKLGILVVLGSFDNNENHIIRGMRQIGVNPIQKYLNVSNTNFMFANNFFYTQNNPNLTCISVDEFKLTAMGVIHIDIIRSWYSFCLYFYSWTQNAYLKT